MLPLPDARIRQRNSRPRLLVLPLALTLRNASHRTHTRARGARFGGSLRAPLRNYADRPHSVGAVK